MAKDTHMYPLSGIGGWLLLLVIGLMVLGPLRSLGEISIAALGAREEHLPGGTRR